MKDAIFSGLDFSHIDLANSIFDYVKLDGAILNVESSSEFLWRGIIWWTAKEIDANLLQQLLARFKPYMIPKDLTQGYYRDAAVIKPNDWTINIRRLCINAHMNCTDEQIHADFPKDF